MEEELFKNRLGNMPLNSNWQADFNKFVDNYNDDYLFFLQRAASGNYNCLITSARILKDFHSMVIFMQRASGLQSETAIFPFVFNHEDDYYHRLGFETLQIESIRGFFEYVKITFNQDFEACMREETEFLCTKLQNPVKI